MGLPVADPSTTDPISSGIWRSTSWTGCTNSMRGLSRCHTCPVSTVMSRLTLAPVLARSSLLSSPAPVYGTSSRFYRTVRGDVGDLSDTPIGDVGIQRDDAHGTRRRG